MSSMAITLNDYLILSTIIFMIGMYGALRRKNLLMLFFSTEIMLNAVNIGMAAISKFHGDLTGQMFAFFIIAIAASEVAIGLGLLVLWYKRNNNINLDSLQSMKG
jgi:NADH-quinone oxidoreductase subunit K